MERRESEKLNGHRAGARAMRDNESKRRVCIHPPSHFLLMRFENGRVPSVKVGSDRVKRYAQGLNSDENSAVVKGLASSTASLRRC